MRTTHYGVFSAAISRNLLFFEGMKRQRRHLNRLQIRPFGFLVRAIIETGRPCDQAPTLTFYVSSFPSYFQEFFLYSLTAAVTRKSEVTEPLSWKVCFKYFQGGFPHPRTFLVSMPHPKKDHLAPFYLVTSPRTEKFIIKEKITKLFANFFRPIVHRIIFLFCFLSWNGHYVQPW